jgi:hypothetical protein
MNTHILGQNLATTQALKDAAKRSKFIGSRPVERFAMESS